MTLEYAESLWLLLLLLLVGVVSYISFVGAKARLSRIVGSHAKDTFFDSFVFIRFMTTFSLLLALGFLIIALSDPRWGEESVEDERRGLEIVYLMDVSNSMLAEDIPPNRVSRSRDVARAVQNRLSGVFTSVVTFKGGASVVTPMTEDSVAFELAMDFLSGTLVTTPGTNLEAALETAVALFPDGTGRRKLIILFSDGQEMEGDVHKLVRELQEREMTVLSIISGTNEGALIPLADGGVLRDGSGNPVVAGVNGSVLSAIAEETGGRAWYLNDAGLVSSLSNTLNELSGADRSVVFRVVDTARFRLFLILALIALAGGMFIESRRRGTVI